MEQQESLLNIAVVDDDESILDAVKIVLEDEHWATQTYTSGEAFVADLTRHQPDCIILDSSLPRMSSQTVAQTVFTEQPNIPVIVLTAYPSSLQTTRLRELGVRDVLVKPVTAKALIGHIQAAVKPH